MDSYRDLLQKLLSCEDANAGLGPQTRKQKFKDDQGKTI